MSRLWSVIRASWRAESQRKNIKRTRQEQEFLPAALEIVETPALPMARLVLLSICFAVCLAIVWAFVGRLDIHSVMQGRIVPTGQIKMIEPFGYSIVRKIHVKAGDVVKKGDLLVELNPTEQEADLERMISEYKTAHMIVERFKAMAEFGEKGEFSKSLIEFPVTADIDLDMHNMHQDHLRSVLEAHQARLASVDAEIAQLEIESIRLHKTVKTRQKIIHTFKIELAGKKELNKKQFASNQEVLLAERALLTEQAVLVDEQGQITSIQAGIEKLRRQREEEAAIFMEKALTGLTEAERNLASLKQELVKAREREERLRLTAPVAGTVRRLKVHTQGDVVAPGELLMVIVPKDVGLEVEAMLDNKDKGFVVKDQDARIKIDAFPFTRYGVLEGKIEDVSNDSVAQGDQGALMFPIRVSLSQEHMVVAGEKRELTSGMTVTVEVRTGERRVIEYFLDPLLRYKDEAARER